MLPPMLLEARPTSSGTRHFSGVYVAAEDPLWVLPTGSIQDHGQTAAKGLMGVWPGTIYGDLPSRCPEAGLGCLWSLPGL